MTRTPPLYAAILILAGSAALGSGIAIVIITIIRTWL